MTQMVIEPYAALFCAAQAQVSPSPTEPENSTLHRNSENYFVLISRI